MVTQLPDKPSELITLALQDLAKSSQSNKYIINMSAAWHRPVDGKCSVCLAGAVMAQTLGGSKKISLVPGSFDAATRSKLRALNMFRLGKVGLGFNLMGFGLAKLPRDLFHVDIPPYEQDKDKFFEAMSTLAGQLGELGF